MPVRVLAITSELPWPLNTGGHIRSFHLLRAIARRFDLRLIAGVDTSDDPGVAVLTGHGIKVLPAVNGQRRRAGEAISATRSALAGEPYVMFHRHNRPAMRNAIVRALHEATPDVVYLDHLDPYAFRPLFPSTPLLIDFHNIYGRLASRVAAEHRGLVGRYIAHQARLLSRVEARAAVDARVVMAVSQQEVEAFRGFGATNVVLVPNGVDCASYDHLPAGRAFDHPVLLYLGALSWQPNAAAAEYLARTVLPEVRRTFPDAVLQLVGRDPGAATTALGALPGVEVHANVPDVQPYLEKASLLAVALDSGGGTRLKILEAFAAGLPVVSTPVGCEGIDAQHGEHLWIVPYEGFSAGVVAALSDPAGASERAVRARTLAHERYDWSALSHDACQAVEAAGRP